MIILPQKLSKYFTWKEALWLNEWSRLATEEDGLNQIIIDHIMPLCSFDLTNIKEFLEAVNYKNLQPLFAKDNFKKGSKIEGIKNDKLEQ